MTRNTILTSTARLKQAAILSFCGFRSVFRYAILYLLAILAWMQPMDAQSVKFGYVQTTLPASELSGPWQAAKDAAGNVYIADSFNARVVELPAGGGPQITLPLTGLNDPNGIAVDKNGNLFVGDFGTGSVIELPAGGSQKTVVSGLIGPTDLAVDATGNLFIADGVDGVYELPVGGSLKSVFSLSSGDIFGVAVDKNGNLFMADTTGSTILELKFGASSPITLPITGLKSPFGVTVDTAGNIFVADTANFRLVEYPAAGGILFTIGSGIGEARALSPDGAGGILVASSTGNKVWDFSPGAVNFGNVNVCPSGQSTPALCSNTVTLNYLVTGSGTLGTPQVFAGGVASLDYSVAAGSTCTGAVTAGDVCTVKVTFAPQLAGSRTGAVQIVDGSNNVLSTVLVYGIGVGPQIAFGPGAQTTVGSGLINPAGVTVDAAGNVFIADAAGYVYKVPAGGGVQTTVGTGLQQPVGVAVDAAGDVFIADEGAHKVYRVPADGSAQTTVGSGLQQSVGVAVDAAGDVFIADPEARKVYKVPADGSAQTTVGSGLSSPYGVALDAAGDVFIADGTKVYKVPADGSAQTTVGSGLIDPTSVEVDAAGNVFIADEGAHKVYKVPADGSAQTTIGSGLIDPTGVALNAAGDVFIADGTKVYKVNLSQPPSFSFANTNVGSQSAAQSVTVQNIGNTALTTTGLIVGKNFGQVAGSGTPADCTASTSLIAGASCNLSISFMPTTGGALTGAATLMDNSLNGNPATQSIPLSGMGVQVTVMVTVGVNIPGLSFSVDGVSYTTPQTFTWTIGGQHSLATTSPQTAPGNAQYTFSQWSDSGAISHTVTASASTTSYAANFQTTASPLLTGTPGGTLRNDFSGFVGMKFTVGAAPLNVLSLGRVYLTGNSQTHVVKLVDAYSGLDVPNASVAVTMTPGTANAYQYTPLSTAVVLAPNSSYFLLTQEFTSGDMWYDFAPVTANPSAMVNGPEYQASVGSYILQFSGPDAYGPPNMLFVGGTIIPPPAVNITAPTSGAAVKGTISLTATATAASGLTITSVQFRLNGNNFGAALTTATTPPSSYYSLSLDTTTLLTAMNTVTAVATDSNGGTTTATAVPFTVVNSPSSAGPFLTGAPGGTLRNDYAGFVGLKFTVGATPLAVSQIGRWVAAASSGTHIVKFADATGTDVPNGWVSLSLTGAPAGQYAYAALASPVTLAANTTYYLVTQESVGGDRWYDAGPVVANSAGVVIAPAYQQSNGFYITQTPGPNSYGPPNFLFTAGGTVTPPPPPPTVIVTAPTGGSTVSGTVALSAAATPASGLIITGVQFRINGANVGPVLTGIGPYTYSLDTTTLANATDNLTAVATDSAGNTGTSAMVVLTINNPTAPPPAGAAFLTSTPPTAGTLRNDYPGYVGMKFTVGATPLVVTKVGRWTVAGNTAMHIVKLVQANGTDMPGGSVTLNLAGATPGTYTYAALGSPVTLLANTSYFLMTQESVGGDQWYDFSPVTATGAGAVNAPAYQQSNGNYVTLSPGSSSYGPPNFLYSAGSSPAPEPPPTVTITSPSAGTVSGTINLTATATPSDSLTITSLQFLINGANVGPLLTAAPYNYMLDTTTLANGPYTVTAIAKDSAGSTGTSSPGVVIMVNNPSSLTTPLDAAAPTSNLRNDYAGFVGLGFTVGSTPIKVSQLGRWVVAGNSGMHTVKLVDAVTGVDVTGGSVSINTASAATGQYAYVMLTSPLTLPANHSYYLLTQETYGGDFWYDAGAVKPNSAVTLNGPAFQQSNLSYALLSDGADSYGPVSLLFGF